MSTYIALGKNPKSFEERKELLAKKIETEEYFFYHELTHIQKKVIEFLISAKGYTHGDIEVDKNFRVELPETSFSVTADIVVNLDNKRIFIIKCAINSLESWERHSIAFCRVVESYQIPYAVVTDSENARVLDAVSGKLISEGIDFIPSKEGIRQTIKQIAFCPYHKEKCEKEKRILYAFDVIKCSVDSRKTE